MEFQDRSVLVTGAAGGIGRATAVKFAREGARLTLSDRDTVRGEETLSAVRAAGGTAQFIYGDVASEPFVQHLVDAAVKTYGSLDCAFNNAGIIGSEAAAVDQSSLEAWQNVMAVNLTSVFLCLKYEARAMLRTGAGAIVNTSSALGHVAAYNMPAYCASKAAVDGMTRALGCEWGKYGITVNAIAPTVFRSPLTAWMFEDNEKAKGVRAGFLARVPVGRLGEPEDLAGPLLFLCSRASDFHTGHVVYADGGYTAG